jgi:ribosomal protein S18 acetylase RimI-like enzyme
MGNGLQRRPGVRDGSTAEELRVEPYAPADVQAVLRLTEYALAHADEQLGSPLWQSRSEVEHELSTWQIPATRSLFVAREHGSVIGVGGVECYPASRMCLLHGPIVAPGARGRGAGAALLRTALRAARWHGMREIHASIGRDNLRAARILTAEGFEQGETNAVYRFERGRHIPLPEAERISLRRAGPNDRDVLALSGRCEPSAQLAADELRSALRDATQHVFVGSLEGQPFGTVVIDTRDTWVYGLNVSDAARERGLGAALLSQALSRFWEESPGAWLGMTVRIDNLTAINLYRRQGFEPWLVLTNYSRAL